MPYGLSNTDYQIWENISHVALWEILWGAYTRYIIIINYKYRIEPSHEGFNPLKHPVVTKGSVNWSRAQLNTARGFPRVFK